MENTSPALMVEQTVSAWSRPAAAASFAAVTAGVVKAAVLAQYQGTGLCFGGSVDADLTPRVRINPSGTPNWSPPV